jgi:hypothetical protein
MGTGSGGGGGSGSGGVPGGPIGGPHYEFEFDEDGFPSLKLEEDEVARVDITEALRKIPRPYLQRQFGNPVIRRFYKDLCTFPEWLDVDDPCQALSEEYGIDDGEGFLVRWVSALMDAYAAEETNVKMRETARMSAEDFLIRALGDNLDLYVKGTCAEVLPELDRRIFDKASESFLGYMILRVLEREYERQPLQLQEQMKQDCDRLADQIVDDFETRYLEQVGLSRCDLFDTVAGKMDWFVKKLREPIRRE